MTEPWKREESAAERAARQQAYERLTAAFRRIGVPAERLAAMLRQVARNEEETRRFLAEQVYGVPDDILDDMVRVRLADLEEGADGGNA
jgi:hypothetical protein